MALGSFPVRQQTKVFRARADMDASKRDAGPPQERHLVTGGGGYVGLRLAKALLKEGHEVTLFDVREPSEDIPEGIRFVKGDVRSADQVREALQGVSCVYHLASYGMSGREQLNKNLIEEVNIGGTNTIIRLCHELCVDRLVYTSTFNVVFGGQEIHHGDESLPYLPLHKHPDWYSRTKSIAEQAVLKASGVTLSNGITFRTCALRLAGVYGPGEQRHLPRIVSYIERGLFCMTYGSRDSLVEFLHVDNLVDAHVKAGLALTTDRGATAAGQAYFISDCKPVNNFEFFRPLVEGLGYSYPKLRVPLSLVYFIAFVTEWIHGVIGRVYNFQPLLTRAEVYKTGVTHYFSNAKARKELGYVPLLQNDMDSVVKWYLDHGHGRKKSSAFKRIFIDILLAVVFAALIMSLLPGVDTLR